MENKFIVERPYEEAKIDRFYWETVNEGRDIVPLIKPYSFLRIDGSEEWYLPTKSKEVYNFKNGSTINLNSLSDISHINIFPPFIYGVDEEITDLDPDDKDSIVIIKPRIYFIINTKNDILKIFENENDLKKELKNIDLPQEYLNPNELYEQYEQDPVLRWFPEDIKKQLEDVKAKKEK